jgi:dTDP-4-amino-4,6-dideoxygalactose transaminase
MSPNVTRAAYHLFPFRYKKEEFQGLSRADFIAALEAEGIPSWNGYAALNTMPFVKDAFKSKTFLKTYPGESLRYDRYAEQNKCPENDRLCNDEAVWFSQYLLLTSKSEMDMIVSAVEKIRKNAGKLKVALKK